MLVLDAVDCMSLTDAVFKNHFLIASVFSANDKPLTLQVTDSLADINGHKMCCLMKWCSCGSSCVWFIQSFWAAAHSYSPGVWIVVILTPKPSLRCHNVCGKTAVEIITMLKQTTENGILTALLGFCVTTLLWADKFKLKLFPSGKCGMYSAFPTEYVLLQL